jgi:hypothetical protein
MLPMTTAVLTRLSMRLKGRWNLHNSSTKTLVEASQDECKVVGAGVRSASK